MMVVKTLIKILLLSFGTHRRRRKIYLTIIQDDGRRHLGFRKTASISLLFDGSSPKLVETLELLFGTYR